LAKPQIVLQKKTEESMSGLKVERLR